MASKPRYDYNEQDGESSNLFLRAYQLVVSKGKRRVQPKRRMTKKQYAEWYEKTMAAQKAARQARKEEGSKTAWASFSHADGTFERRCLWCSATFRAKLPQTKMCPACARASKAAAERGDPGFVYFVECQDVVKIGKARNVSRRISAISTASPFKLRLLFAIRTSDMSYLEGEMHSRFRSKRTRNEWFALDAMDLAGIRREYRPDIVYLRR
jgi:hypothetical protein